LVVFNDFWFPVIKPASGDSTRHLILPIEGSYAIGEVKQSLDEKTLDEAMEKLVKCHRLERPQTFAHRLVENREHCNCVHGLSNPLYSFILALDTKPSITFESLINRFFDICAKLNRLHVIRALCVLGHGTVVWGFDDPDDPLKQDIAPARFMVSDLFEPIYPVFFRSADSVPALYSLMSNLLMHLYDCVLAPEDFATSYGPLRPPTSAPSDRRRHSLPPEKEWLDRLNEPCSVRHR
jgi:hypothetical protein